MNQWTRKSCPLKNYPHTKRRFKNYRLWAKLLAIVNVDASLPSLISVTLDSPMLLRPWRKFCGNILGGGGKQKSSSSSWAIDFHVCFWTMIQCQTQFTAQKCWSFNKVSLGAGGLAVFRVSLKVTVAPARSVDEVVKGSAAPNCVELWP